MRYIFILLFLSLGLSALAQQNIVESLQRNRAGEGTVTIHQDPKITGLIGSIYTGNVTGGTPVAFRRRIAASASSILRKSPTRHSQRGGWK